MLTSSRREIGMGRGGAGDGQAVAASTILGSLHINLKRRR